MASEVAEQVHQASRFAAGYQEAMICGKDIERLRGEGPAR